MFMALGIGFAVMVLVAFGTLAFWVDGGAVEVPQAESVEPTTQVFFQPTGWSNAMDKVPIEEIVAGIEAHLAEERVAAAAFARNPSASNLWLQ